MADITTLRYGEDERVVRGSEAERHAARLALASAWERSGQPIEALELALKAVGLA